MTSPLILIRSDKPVPNGISAPSKLLLSGKKLICAEFGFNGKNQKGFTNLQVFAGAKRANLPVGTDMGEIIPVNAQRAFAEFFGSHIDDPQSFRLSLGIGAINPDSKNPSFRDSNGEQFFFDLSAAAYPEDRFAFVSQGFTQSVNGITPRLIKSQIFGQESLISDSRLNQMHFAPMAQFIGAEMSSPTSNLSSRVVLATTSRDTELQEVCLLLQEKLGVKEGEVMFLAVAAFIRNATLRPVKKEFISYSMNQGGFNFDSGQTDSAPTDDRVHSVWIDKPDREACVLGTLGYSYTSAAHVHEYPSSVIVNNGESNLSYPGGHIDNYVTEASHGKNALLSQGAYVVAAVADKHVRIG